MVVLKHGFPHRRNVPVEQPLGDNAPPELAHADGPGRGRALLLDVHEAAVKHPLPCIRQAPVGGERFGRLGHRVQHEREERLVAWQRGGDRTERGVVDTHRGDVDRREGHVVGEGVR